MITFKQATNSDQQQAIQIIDATLQEFGVCTTSSQNYPNLVNLESSQSRIEL